MNRRMKTSSKEIIIVGQGLAGTLLSFHLHKNGIKHIVVDQSQANSSSKVAAGIINPIGIKRMIKSWSVDQFLPYAKSVYKELEELLNESIFHEIEMDKIYGEQDDEFWKLRLEKGLLHEYVTPSISTRQLPLSIKSPFGFGSIKKGGRLNMPLLLCAYRKFLKTNEMLIDENFSDNDLRLLKDSTEWKGIRAKRIIFCRGEKDMDSEFFENLDFRHTKGELLNVHINGLQLKNILLKGIFVLPLGQEKYKIGATFEHQWKDLSPSKTKLNELLEQWSKISDLNLQIHKQLTGIRPTMHDRRPVIGFLPNSPKVGIFNGLGSRGGLIAPYFAEELSKIIMNSSFNAMKEVRIERYYKSQQY